MTFWTRLVVVAAAVALVGARPEPCAGGDCDGDGVDEADERALAQYACDAFVDGDVLPDATFRLNNGDAVGVELSDDTPFPHDGNKSLCFDDQHDAVTIGGTAGTGLDEFDAITLEAWIKPTTTDGIRHVIWGDDDVYTLAVLNGVLRFGFGVTAVVDFPFTDVDVWTHVAGTYDGQTMRLWVNGEQVGSTALAGYHVGPLGTRDVVRIGNDETADFGTFGRAFRGRIDDVRILDRALPSEAIAWDAAHELMSPCVQVDVSTLVPKITSLDATVPAPGGPVDVHANVEYDRKGRLGCTGTCTVGDSVVDLSGRVSVTRDGNVATFTLRATDGTVKVVVSVDLATGRATVRYAGPDGSVKAADVPVTVGGVGVPVFADLRIFASADDRGRVKGYVQVVSPYGDGTPVEIPLKGRLVGDQLTLKIKKGSVKVTFTGTRQGDVFVGTLNATIPPSRSVDTVFVLPAF